jgi:IK cytokine
MSLVSIVCILLGIVLVLDGLDILLMHYVCYNAGKNNLASGDYDEAVKPSQTNGSALKHQSDMPPPPAPHPRNNNFNGKEEQSVPIARADDDDIFVGDGVDYSVPNKEMSQSPVAEDMEESPHNNHQKQSYFTEPMYGPVPPSESAQAWQQPVSQ